MSFTYFLAHFFENPASCMGSTRDNSGTIPWARETTRKRLVVKEPGSGKEGTTLCINVIHATLYFVEHSSVIENHMIKYVC